MLDNNYGFAIILGVLSMSQNFINITGPYVMFLVSILLKINMYRMKSEENANYISNNIKSDFCSSYTEQGNPIGLIINKAWIPRYIIWVYGDDYERTMSIFCTESVKERLISASNSVKIQKNISYSVEEEKINNEIKYYTRGGNYEYFFYTSRKVIIDKEYTQEQRVISNSITENFKRKGFLTCFIYGKPGSGKTMLSYLLAKSLSACFCDSFNPTEPGESLANLYSKIAPTNDEPLIILLDEVDNIIQNVYENRILKHKKYPIQISDKPSWNLFFDKIDMGLYPNLIVILCSNRTKRELDNLDVSYLRKGRLHVTFELNSKIKLI